MRPFAFLGLHFLFQSKRRLCGKADSECEGGARPASPISVMFRHNTPLRFRLQ
jgi:hypothetical protein